MKEMDIFITNLKRLIDEREWSIIELDRRSGVSRTQISLVLAGERQITVLRAAMIARAFGLRLEDMLKGQLPSQHDIADSRLLDNYHAAPEAGRKVIEQVAASFAQDEQED